MPSPGSDLDASTAGAPGSGQGWAAFALSAAAADAWRVGVGAVPNHPLGSPSTGRVAYVSFETQQRLYERELYEDDSNLQEATDHGTAGLELLTESGAEAATCRAAAEALGLGELLDRGFRLLSTGEARLLLLLREVLAEPKLLVVQEPFEGLDAQWRAAAETLLARFAATGHSWVALLSRVRDVPGCATHWAVLRPDAPPLVRALAAENAAPGELEQLLFFNHRPLAELPAASRSAPALPDPLLRLREGSVHYHLPNGRRATQFAGLNWELRPGQHTLITGPNGAGKSTLLQLITGDHPQCYSNDLWLFGHQRGTGESIWDIKQHIGVVSSALHRDYRARGDALSVVVSGLYDSIGIYRAVPEPDRRLALCWLEVLGLEDVAKLPFERLSWARQRLVLIARALIKHPPLLILDEPTQGLDELGRHLVLGCIQRLAHLDRTTLLFVTHRADERLSLFRHRLTFEPADSSTIRFVVRLTQAEPG